MTILFLLISGKRKSGKDFCARKLVEILTSMGLTVRCRGVSYHLKQIYAQENPDIDFAELLTDSPYKEQHRRRMIEWGEMVRKKDPGFFCRMVEDEARNARCNVFIVPDCRRPTDFMYFDEQTCQKVTIRVIASEELRRQRGWSFVEGIDDADSECALDNWNFDFTVYNSDPTVEAQLKEVGRSKML